MPPPDNGIGLAELTATRLLRHIAENRLAEGARLPPEHELVRQLGISRTVLREAVAGLRAQGLLTSRRGSGVYVAKPAAGFRVVAADARKIPEMLDLLELRAAVEIEAAGIAARRRREDRLADIWAAFEAMEASKAAGIDPDLDFAFHHAIARATGNDRFGWFLTEMGTLLIPRRRIRLEETTGGSASYTELLQAEHRAIASAIDAGDTALARDAMRQHLSGSARRYRAFSTLTPTGDDA